MEKEVQILTARLLAHRYLPRSDALVRRALTDELFRHDLDNRLAQCGLLLLDNPYAEHIAVGLKRELEDPVFGAGEQWLSNNLGLSRDAIAMLVVLWALIILPKRERQMQRRDQADSQQTDLFGEAKPMRFGTEVSPGIAEAMLYADFGEQLGGKMRFHTNLGLLARLGFVQKRQKIIHEGPLLDVLLDYNQLAPRIIEGALADLLSRDGAGSPHQTTAHDLADEEDDGLVDALADDAADTETN
jgi:hypothetical protein